MALQGAQWSGKTKFPLLNEQNYPVWEVRMGAHLHSKDLYKKEQTTRNGIPMLHSLPKDADSDIKALSEIEMYVTDRFLYMIKDCLNSTDALKRLGDDYKRRTSAVQSTITSELARIELGNMSLGDYFEKVRSLAYRVRATGVDYTDEMMCRAALDGLIRLDDYRPMALVLKQTMTPATEYHSIVQGMLAVEADLKLLSTKFNAKSGMYASLLGGKSGCGYCGKGGHAEAACFLKERHMRERAGARRGNRDGNGGGKCYNCGGTGHKAKECPKPKKINNANHDHVVDENQFGNYRMG